MDLIIMLILLGIVIYLVLTDILNPTSRKTTKILEGLKDDKPSITKSLYNGTIGILVKRIAMIIRIEEYDRKRIERNLKKAGFEESITPEIYKAKGIASCIVTLIVGIFFGILGRLFGPVFYILMMTFVIIAPLLYFNNIQKVESKVKEINDQIYIELPQFFSFYTSSLVMTKDTIKIFTDYKEIAGPAFLYDLDVVIRDMATGNHEDALNRFADRINIDKLYDFIRGVISMERGEDQKQYFKHMDAEMNQLEMENVKRRAGKIPSKVRFATIVVVTVGMVLLLAPMIMKLAHISESINR